jgi:predicted N-acyltransferase
VPYSPVPGARLLGDRAFHATLIDAIRSECHRHGLSSVHTNFCDAISADAFSAQDDWLPRFDWQFHWQNRQWHDFDEFLAALKPKKRKNIRQERAHVRAAGVRCEVRHGGEIDAETWRRIHLFYSATFDDKGNYPALTLEFFRHLGRVMPDRVLAVLAWRESELIAAALLLRNRDTLHGRYWGCTETIPGLHFEVCYYQGIEYCLRHGLRRFEPGAQGEHKLARGFLPTKTHSFHYIADARFRSAVRDALAREAIALDAYHDELLAHSPYAAT